MVVYGCTLYHAKFTVIWHVISCVAVLLGIRCMDVGRWETIVEYLVSLMSYMEEVEGGGTLCYRW